MKNTKCNIYILAHHCICILRNISIVHLIMIHRHIREHRHMRTYAHSSTYLYTCILGHIQIYLHRCMHTYSFIYMYTCIYIHTYMCCTYMHMCMATSCINIPCWSLTYIRWYSYRTCMDVCIQQHAQYHIER